MNDEQLNDEKLPFNFQKQINEDCQQPWSDKMSETTQKQKDHNVSEWVTNMFLKTP